MEINFDWESNGVVICPRGILTLQDYLEGNNRLTSDERFDSLRFIISDLRDVERIELDERELKIAAEVGKVGTRFIQRRICHAYVITRAEARDFVQHAIENYLHKEWGRRIFATMEDARQWCEACVQAQRNGRDYC